MVFEEVNFPSSRRQLDLDIRRMGQIPDNCSLSFDGAVPGCHRDLLIDFSNCVFIFSKFFVLKIISLKLKLLYVVPRDSMPTVADMIPVLPAKGAAHVTLLLQIASDAKAQTELGPARFHGNNINFVVI